MGAVPFWSDETDTTGLWNRVFLDDLVLPGLARVRGKLEPEIEVKKAKGEDGANYTDNGLAPCKFQIELCLWNEDQWEAYQDLLPTILPRKRGAARKAWEVYHPGLTLLGVGKAYLTAIGMPEPDDDGLLKILIECIEYNPAPKPVKPGGNAADNAVNTFERDRNWEDTRTSYGYGEGDTSAPSPAQDGGAAGAAAGNAAAGFM
jgi:hypothetical protein